MIKLSVTFNTIVMKVFIMIRTAIVLTVLISCKKVDDKPAKGTGTLVFDIGLSVHEKEVDQGLKSLLLGENFQVTVHHEDGTAVFSFETVSDTPDSIELEPGTYYISASSGNLVPAAFESPCYYGESETFTINRDTREIITLTCSLSNTMVSVIYSEALRNSFTDYRTLVSAGTDTLIFGKSELRPGFFEPSPLQINAELCYRKQDGTTALKKLTGSIPDPLPGKHYEINVNTTPDIGSGIFKVLANSEEIPVVTIPVGDAEPAGPPETGDLIISEIMYDPSALGDTEGEWIEVFNRSSHRVDLCGLILRRDSTYHHEIEDTVILGPGEYYILARAAVFPGTLPVYVYGTVISFPNTGAVLSLNYPDVDSGTEVCIFSVDYGVEGFPSPSGASVCLDPDKLYSPDAGNPGSWCISNSVFFSGDKGTPGSMNDSCL